MAQFRNNYLQAIITLPSFFSKHVAFPIDIFLIAGYSCFDHLLNGLLQCNAYRAALEEHPEVAICPECSGNRQ